MSELAQCPVCGCARDPGYKESIKYVYGYWETPGKGHVSGCGNALQVVNELRAQYNIERNHCDSSADTITALRAQVAELQTENKELSRCLTTDEAIQAMHDAQKQLADMQSDAEVGRALHLEGYKEVVIRHYPERIEFTDPYDACYVVYTGKPDERHNWVYEDEQLAPTLKEAMFRAAGLLPKEAAR